MKTISTYRILRCFSKADGGKNPISLILFHLRYIMLIITMFYVFATDYSDQTNCRDYNSRWQSQKASDELAEFT